MVRITRKQPFALLPAEPGRNKGLAIVPKEEVAKGNFDKHPVGTGAFQFVEYVPGDHVTIKRFNQYWEQGLPYLDQVTFKVIPDETVKQTNLQTGNVDWVDSLPPQNVNRLMQSKEIVVVKRNGSSYYYIGVNLRRKPFGDVRVRRAISYAIDRDAVAAAAVWDTGAPSETPIPADSPWASTYKPYARDVTKAKELLQEAGASNLTIELMPTSNYPETVRAAQAIGDELSEAGVKTKIRSLEWNTWLDTEGHGDFDAYICGWIGLVDPDDYFYAQQHTGQIFNFTGYSNPALDKMLDQGRETTDMAKRKTIYLAVQKTLIDDLPYVYLFTRSAVNAWLPRVHGYVVLPNSAIRFKSVWIEPK